MEKNNFKLFIDTSSLDIILELRQNQKIVERIKKSAEKKQSELLIPAIKKLLKKHNLKIKNVKLIPNPGPGRFTSLRVGIATVNAINFALGRDEIVKPNYGQEPNIG